MVRLTLLGTLDILIPPHTQSRHIMARNGTYRAVWVTAQSGAAPGDRPTATLVLASEDTDRAQTDTDDYEED